MEDNQGGFSRLDGLQQLVARKEAENTALRVDLVKNMSVLQQSKDAIQQFQRLLEQKAGAEKAEAASTPHADHERELARALDRAMMAEQKACRLQAILDKYEELVNKTRQDMIWLWQFSRSSDARIALPEPKNTESKHAEIFQAAAALLAKEIIETTESPAEPKRQVVPPPFTHHQL